MTMIDEGTLRDALADAANSFAPSHDALSRIFETARVVETHDPPRLASLLRGPRSGRILLAAAAIVAVGAISVPLLRSEGAKPVTVTALKALHAPLAPPNAKVGLVIGGTADSPTLSSRAQGATASSGSSPTTGASSVVPRIESSGSISLGVRDGVTPAFDELGALAERDGGSVQSSEAQVGGRGAGHFAYGTIVLRVPQRAFATLVRQVQRVGHATSIVTTSRDVTGQYVDLQARIRAEEASRQQYLMIMTRASSIDGILAVQRQLDVIQSQIEQLQGQLNVLHSQTTYGSLTVNLSSDANSPNVVHVSGISRAVHDAIHGFVSGVEWLIRLSGPVLFALLLLAVLLVLVRFAWRVARRRA